MYMKKEYPNFVVEIDWDLDLSSHGDDYISVFDLVDEYTFVMVADGVTECTSGRVASVFLSKYLKECLDEYIGHKGAFFYSKEISLEKVFLEALKCAVKKLREMHSKVVSFKDLLSFRRKFKSVTEEFMKFQEFVDKSYGFAGLPNEIITHAKRMTEMSKSLVDDLNVLWKGLEGELEIPDIEKTIKSSIIKGQEDAEKVYLDIERKIEQNEPSKIDFETTLALLAIEEKNLSTPYIKITTLCYGDTEINIVRKTGIEIHSKFPPERLLTSFISSREGAQGSSNLITRFINEELIIVVSSDGGNVYYTKPQGYHGVLFSNKLNQWIEQKKSIEGFSKDWIDYLRKESALNDDASLAVIRILPKAKPTEIISS
jgi:hypothetical protein